MSTSPAVCLGAKTDEVPTSTFWTHLGGSLVCVSMSYAEGGTEIPAGKQLPYAKATSQETRYVQLKPGYVFENSLVKGYEAQALFSHIRRRSSLASGVDEGGGGGGGGHPCIAPSLA